MIPRRLTFGVLAGFFLAATAAAEQDEIKSLSELIEKLSDASNRVEAIGKSVFEADTRYSDNINVNAAAKKVLENYKHQRELTVSNYTRVQRRFNNLIDRITFDLKYSKAEFSADSYKTSIESIESSYRELAKSYRMTDIRDQVPVYFWTIPMEWVGKAAIEALFGTSIDVLWNSFSEVRRRSATDDSYKQDAISKLRHIAIAPYGEWALDNNDAG